MYKYSVSFNCSGPLTDVGGGSDGESSIDYVGNDLTKIENFLVKDANTQGYNENGSWSANREHEMVGSDCDVGGPIVSVIEETDENNSSYVLCVILRGWEQPTIIE